MKLTEFLNKSVSDVMITDVSTLHRDDTVADAADRFLKEQISGAPVVDDQARCIGVISITDLVAAPDKAAVQKAALADAFFAKSELILKVSSYESELQRVRDNQLPSGEERVESLMVSDLVTVKSDAKLEEALRDFLEAKIHRVLVVDDDDKLVGLLTTVDVIAALLSASVSD